MTRKNPHCELNNVEYLCLKIFLNPGQSQRFYRMALARYKGGNPSPEKVGNGLYFRRNGRYRDVLWTDRAPKDCVDKMPFMAHFGREYRKPRVSQMHVTEAGRRKAIEAGVKIGLFEVPTMAQVEPGDFVGIPVKGDPNAAVAISESRPIGFR